MRKVCLVTARQFSNLCLEGIFESLDCLLFTRQTSLLQGIHSHLVFGGLRKLYYVEGSSQHSSHKSGGKREKNSNTEGGKSRIIFSPKSHEVK